MEKNPLFRYLKWSTVNRSNYISFLRLCIVIINHCWIHEDSSKIANAYGSLPRGLKSRRHFWRTTTLVRIHIYICVCVYEYLYIYKYIYIYVYIYICIDIHIMLYKIYVYITHTLKLLTPYTFWLMCILRSTNDFPNQYTRYCWCTSPSCITPRRRCLTANIHMMISNTNW